MCRLQIFSQIFYTLKVLVLPAFLEAQVLLPITPELASFCFASGVNDCCFGIKAEHL